ncbi:MAG TPA: HAD hydrolase-like protein [Burkholderiaceae bacterium]|nr:HAD hydrolase-like protein [Burkholderiaceae bacterium]
MSAQRPWGPAMRIDGFDHVVFDMDGVLLDSNGMKIEAARQAFAAVDPRPADEFASHFRHNFGLTRREHFVWGWRELLQPLGHQDTVIDTMMDDYARRVGECYRSCPVTDGTHDLLQHVDAPCYVLTGSGQDEARSLLKQIGLAPGFVEILGSPRGKLENLRGLAQTHSIQPDRGVLIGDSRHDFATAQAFGLSFVLVTRYMPFDAADLADEVLACDGVVVDTLRDLIPSGNPRC